MDFNRYFTNEEIRTVLKGWADRFPSLASVQQIGESFKKSPIWLLTLTNQATGVDRTKPAMWIDANIHATELAGATTALYVAYQLLEGYGRDERITRLLDSSTFYIVPRVNPDGADLALADNPRFIRSSVRPYPWDEKDEGLHPQDINGDGKILQMRIEDPNGDWKISSLDPRLMEKRGPDEFGGTYYRMLAEGLLEDYDGYLIKPARPVEGLDLNRTFPFEWRPEGDQEGAGPYPTSEPETKALVDFLSSHNNISTGITFHTYSGVILRPYSTKSDDDMETNDLWVYQMMGEMGTELTGYRAISTFHDFKYHPKEVTTGGFDDWLYDHLGTYTFTIELWDLPTKAGIKDRKFIEWFRKHPHEDDLKILQWIDANGGEGAYIDWFPYTHPQLGKVELGGWNSLYTWRNPPHQFMGEEAARNLPFVLSLAGMLPQMTIHTLDIEPLGEQSYRIHLVVDNTGYLPTFTSEQGKKRKAIRPVRAELEIPEGAKLVSGKRKVELGHLEGRSNKFDVVAMGTTPTDNRARTEWVVRAPAGTTLTLKVLSDRAGSIEREVILI